MITPTNNNNNNNNNDNNNNNEFSESKEKINHLLFMDDLKLYSRSKKGLDS